MDSAGVRQAELRYYTWGKLCYGYNTSCTTTALPSWRQCTPRRHI